MAKWAQGSYKIKALQIIQVFCFVTVLSPKILQVLTVLGSAIVISFRPEDNMYEVRLPFGIGYIRASSIIGAEQLSSNVSFDYISLSLFYCCVSL